METIAKTTFAAVLLTTSGIATAGSESGLYLGASLGSSSIDFNVDNVDLNDDDTAYKIFLGYNLGLIPFIDLAIEGSYVDFGSASSIDVGNTDVGVTGLSAFGLAGFKLGPIGLFGKAGFINWDSESDVLQAQLDDSGSDPAYGIGARFQLGSLAIRAEYEIFDIDTVDIDYYSVGVAWTF